MKLQWEKRERFFKEMTFQIVLRGGKDLGRWRVTDGASLVAQMVKSLPAVQETRVQSLNLEDLLEKGMATNIVFLPREFHRQRILESHSTWDCKELDKTD